MPFPWTPAGASSPSVYSEQTEPRTRAHRLSRWFHGTSTMAPRSTDTERGTVPPSPKSVSTSAPSLPQLEMSHINLQSPALRSPTSTRSLIDPSSSPSTSARPLSTRSYEASVMSVTTPAQAQVLDYGGNSPIDMEAPPEHTMSYENRTRSVRQPPQQTRNERNKPRWVPRHSRGKVWFPAMEDRIVRTKVFHTLVSGLILAVFLIVCTYSFPPHHPSPPN